MVVRLNIAEKVGRQMAGKYDITRVPTFIVFDGEGQERLRQSGQWPNERRIRDELLGEESG